ncbi:hypothetical protein SULYE_1525 [Sulfurihydrogenibium yellowstonense SS-5]|uniref:Uncharacterized protein n=1 Tax=Sulfurihydrogenibium yellowstonense SS-5 TaxID=432331 RepID=C4FLS1_9AQUI|nr:hypothetical protein SULYE_1525 [Sulfurihydrogenibium yellowstonense SS-5]
MNFLTHTVQMELGRSDAKIDYLKIFLTHTVQMEHIRDV